MICVNYLISTYFRDFCYIKNFQVFKKEGKNDFLKGKFCSFDNFLNDYRIARRIKIKDDDKVTKRRLKLDKILDYEGKQLTVDNIATKLQKNKITNSFEISLISKILYLSNRWNIFPFDGRVNGVFPSNKRYSIYLLKVKEFRKNKEIGLFLKKYSHILKQIEHHSNNILEQKLNSIETIRENRFIDILLWMNGAEILRKILKE